MWKLFNYLFGWDYVLTKYTDSWGVHKVTWFHQDAFCRPCMSREFINNSEHTEDRTIWKPLTPNMLRYKWKLQKEELRGKINERT